jgi:hypothetical protein
MRARDVLWVLKAMTVVPLPVLRPGPGGVSALSASAGVIFIRMGRRWVRPMVTSSNTLAVSSVDCRLVMTDVLPERREGSQAGVMTVVHDQKVDLRGGSGVFAMAADRCAFS